MSKKNICPPHKFSFISGCMSWMKVVNITGFFALFVIIFLIYMTYNKTNITFVNPIQMSNKNNFWCTFSSTRVLSS